jgi:hypothetical protein
MLVDLVSTRQVFSYAVLNDMVSLILQFDFLGKQFSTRSNTNKSQGRSAPKTNQLIGRPYATYTPILELIWKQVFKIKSFVDILLSPQDDLELWHWPSNGAIK